jgi:hypothetical protein
MKYIFIILVLSLLNCSCGNRDSIVDIDNGYQIFFEGATVSWISGNNLKISCNILSYVCKENFMLVAQEPDKNCFPHDPKIQAIKDVDIIQFWIIETKKHKLYGPFKLSDFLKKRKELGVPENMKLKIEL